MKPLNKKTVLKYLDFLNDVHEKCLKTEYFTFRDLCIKHKISKGASIEIKRGGIIAIDSIGYKWNTIKPNIKMAEELLRRTNKKRDRFKAPKVNVVVKKNGRGRKTKELEVKEFLEKNPTKNKTISILWGLIKINTNN